VLNSRRTLIQSLLLLIKLRWMLQRWECEQFQRWPQRLTADFVSSTKFFHSAQPVVGPPNKVLAAPPVQRRRVRYRDRTAEYRGNHSERAAPQIETKGEEAAGSDKRCVVYWLWILFQIWLRLFGMVAHRKRFFLEICCVLNQLSSSSCRRNSELLILWISYAGTGIRIAEIPEMVWWCFSLAQIIRM